MIQIAICDNDREEIFQLKNIISEVMDVFLVQYSIHEFVSGEKLLESAIVFDLVFLDIALSDYNGIEIGTKIYQKYSSVKMIFQSDCIQYCQAAVNEAHAFAFLEKPLSKSLLKVQIEDFLQKVDDMQGIRAGLKNVKYRVEKRVVSKDVLSISVENILYFEYLQSIKEIKVVTEKGDFFCSEKIGVLEERMKPFGFEMCCRGFIVNLNRITRIKRYTIILDSGESIPLSQRRSTEFKIRIGECRKASL